MLQAGDDAARQEFWNNGFNAVLGVCSRVMGKGPAAVDITTDLLNDFVFHYVNQLSHPGGAWAYLKLMAVRRSVRERQRVLKGEEYEDQRICSPTNTAINEDMALLRPELNDCLDTLTPKAQSVIRLKYRQGLPNEQIGRAVGGSKQYIGRLLKQSLVLLRECLQRKAVTHA